MNRRRTNKTQVFIKTAQTGFYKNRTIPKNIIEYDYFVNVNNNFLSHTSYFFIYSLFILSLSLFYYKLHTKNVQNFFATTISEQGDWGYATTILEQSSMTHIT